MKANECTPSTIYTGNDCGGSNGRTRPCFFRPRDGKAFFRPPEPRWRRDERACPLRHQLHVRPQLHTCPPFGPTSHHWLAHSPPGLADACVDRAMKIISALRQIALTCLPFGELRSAVPRVDTGTGRATFVRAIEPERAISVPVAAPEALPLRRQTEILLRVAVKKKLPLLS
jgi:hypothetical protein